MRFRTACTQLKLGVNETRLLQPDRLEPAQGAVVANEMQRAVDNDHEPDSKPFRRAFVKAGLGTLGPWALPGAEPVLQPDHITNKPVAVDDQVRCEDHRNRGNRSD